jgi:hypothetical protein
MMRTLILALILLSGPAWGAIGSVTETKGSSCSIERDKSQLPGDKGASIESMDTYVTGKCESDITFTDDTKVKVNENSRLLIDDFVFDPKQSDAGKLALKVGMGTVRYASGQIAKNNPQKVNIKTPAASIAVRGTDFTMTVDEAGQSLIVLLPSCKDGEKKKEYELEENTCKVGKIDVETLAGKVTLDQAFQGTFAANPTTVPTPPRILNITEGKINNFLILSQPPEITQARHDSAGKDKDKETEADLEEFVRHFASQAAHTNSERAEVLNRMQAPNEPSCDPHKNVCVAWEMPNNDIKGRGKGIAYRIVETQHYAEVKTLGYSSNTYVSITQDDNTAFKIIGDGGPGGNAINIKQNTGVLRPQ